jgi:hypothetical protein
MSDREIHVKLIADVDDYVVALDRAKAATKALAEELRACGISEAELPKAIKTAMRIVKDEDGDPKFAVAI